MVRKASRRQGVTRQRAGLAAGAAILWLASGALPAFAADDALLSRLEGEWVGNGTVHMAPGAPAERIYCKIANRLVDSGASLEQKGRCAVGTNSGSLKGKISARGKGQYEGTLDSPQTAGPATLAGQAENDRIVLSAQFIDRFSRRPSLSIISLQVGDGGAYRLVADTLNPESGKHFQTSDILFKPSKKNTSKK